MAKRTKTKIRTKLGYDEAAAQLASVKDMIGSEARQHAELSRSLAKLGQSLKALRTRERSLLRIVDIGPERVKPVRQAMENPLKSEGLVAAELSEGSGSAGFVDVDVNLTTRIGGLARLAGHLDEFQMVAAAKFRSCWDQAQIGGARAIDYTMPRVDTSGSGHADLVSMSGDAMAQYTRAVRSLGMIKSNLVQCVVCEDMSLRQLAKKLGRPAGGKAGEALRDEVLDAVDGLVAAFGTKAVGRQRMRGDAGERLPMPPGKREVVYSDPCDEVVNNKAA